MMKSRATQKRYFWNYLETQNYVILLMNKTSRLKNTLINLRVVFRFVVRRKWLHHSPLLIRSQTSVHLAVNGFSDFMRPREGFFPPQQLDVPVTGICVRISCFHRKQIFSIYSKISHKN